MKPFAVIDTNVIVSALLSSNPDTPPYQVLSHLFTDDFTPLLNDEIIGEYETVLKRKKKYRFDDRMIDTLISIIKEKGIHAERSGEHEGVLDEKDYVFYEVAMSREDSFLVTGNLKHFPLISRVVSPKEFLEILQGGRD